MSIIPTPAQAMELVGEVLPAMHSMPEQWP